MDLVKFLNDVTGGHLLAWKVVAASVVFGLAGLQVAMAAGFWHAASIPGINPSVAVRIHRISGRAAVTGTCRELYDHRSWLWTFGEHEGVEPTNNSSERALRHAVIRYNDSRTRFAWPKPLKSTSSNSP